jgi:hypothetical protein
VPARALDPAAVFSIVKFSDIEFGAVLLEPQIPE